MIALMNEAEPDLIHLVEARRHLAVTMLKGFEANAFDTPHTPEDVAYYERELSECDATLAELRNA
jgi:uncharacterized protein with NAD-binding domain and iron-sulfur cluster